MSDWIPVALGDLIQLQRGHDLPSQDRVEGSVPIVGSFGITGWHNKPRYDGPGVAIGRSGASIGQATFVSEPYWPLNTCLFVSDFRGNDPRWVFHLLDGIDFNAFNSGSAQPSLNRNFLRNIPVMTPPIHEQQAIAEVLGALDDKIAANTKLAATADEFLAAQFSALMESEFVEIRLGDIAEVNAETVKPVQGGLLRYIDIASVGVGVHEYPEATSWDDAPSRARRRVRKGDTLWSTVRPNRRSHSLNLSDDPLLVGSTGLAVLSPVKVGFAYLYEVTKRPEFTSYLENVAEGSAYPAVRADRFSDALIPLLPQVDLIEFEALAAPIREHIHSLSVENQTLAATRDALLPQLMSGKLRVKDLESIVSAAV